MGKNNKQNIWHKKIKGIVDYTISNIIHSIVSIIFGGVMIYVGFFLEEKNIFVTIILLIYLMFSIFFYYIIKKKAIEIKNTVIEIKKEKKNIIIEIRKENLNSFRKLVNSFYETNIRGNRIGYYLNLVDEITGYVTTIEDAIKERNNLKHSLRETVINPTKSLNDELNNLNHSRFNRNTQSYKCTFNTIITNFENRIDDLNNTLFKTGLHYKLKNKIENLYFFSSRMREDLNKII